MGHYLLTRVFLRRRTKRRAAAAATAAAAAGVGDGSGSTGTISATLLHGYHAHACAALIE